MTFFYKVAANLKAGQTGNGGGRRDHHSESPGGLVKANGPGIAVLTWQKFAWCRQVQNLSRHGEEQGEAFRADRQRAIL
ncbi:MAG: hypothetical protein MZW92_17870 [Comamonadaceae bacterium]|nr:hypothetical protein [Comamonadaceae bacterium]